MTSARATEAHWWQEQLRFTIFCKYEAHAECPWHRGFEEICHCTCHGLDPRRRSIPSLNAWYAWRCQQPVEDVGAEERGQP